MSPAAPAITPPMRKVSEIVVSTLIPINRAASGSCAVARIALPSRVVPMNATMATTSGIVTAKASRSAAWMLIPRMVVTCFWAQIRSSTDAGEPPSQSSPTFCRMKDMPPAVDRDDGIIGGVDRDVAELAVGAGHGQDAGRELDQTKRTPPIQRQVQ